MANKPTGLMKHTMFTIPGVSHFFRFVSSVVLKVLGWKFTGLDYSKDLKKCVVIAAPHTSGWDFPFTLMLVIAARIPVYWAGKTELFRFPIKTLLRWMGGVEVDRANASSLVDSLAEEIKNSDSMYLILAAEGTRKKVKKWKTGFYRIAVAADVPILLGYLDFKKKRGGFLRLYEPSGDYDKDLIEIKNEYVGIQGKRSK